MKVGFLAELGHQFRSACPQLQCLVFPSCATGIRDAEVSKKWSANVDVGNCTNGNIYVAWQSDRNRDKRGLRVNGIRHLVLAARTAVLGHHHLCVTGLRVPSSGIYQRCCTLTGPFGRQSTLKQHLTFVYRSKTELYSLGNGPWVWSTFIHWTNVSHFHFVGSEPPFTWFLCFGSIFAKWIRKVNYAERQAKESSDRGENLLVSGADLLESIPMATRNNAPLMGVVRAAHSGDEPCEVIPGRLRPRTPM